MSDIVERLRNDDGIANPTYGDLKEAADLIDSLRQRVNELEETVRKQALEIISNDEFARTSRFEEQLASSQHYAQQLREALKTSLKFSYHKNTCTYSSREESQCTCGLHDHLDSVKEIAANHDTSALKDAK